jgi:general stress protein 26
LAIDTLTKKQLEATEMWFYHRMLKILWTATKSNETVLLQVKQKENFLIALGDVNHSFLELSLEEVVWRTLLQLARSRVERQR